MGPECPLGLDMLLRVIADGGKRNKTFGWRSFEVKKVRETSEGFNFVANFRELDLVF